MERYQFTLDALIKYRNSVGQSFTAAEVLHISKGIIDGLLHLHNNGFVHRYKPTRRLSLLFNSQYVFE
jgi:serine/threonine protein kinase